VLAIEARAVADLVERVDDSFVAAARYMLSCRGRVVVLGMGKSGHIGGKIRRDPGQHRHTRVLRACGEACHGDMGMITASDVVLALSNSARPRN